MCKFRKLYGFIIGIFICIPLIVKGQSDALQLTNMQSFSLAGGSYVAPNEASFWLDWKLDLGITALAYNQSSDYYFTPGLLQPNINKFTQLSSWKETHVPFQIRYLGLGKIATLYSSEPDLIIYGIKIYNSNGQLVITELVKIASGFLAKNIHLSTLSSGVYYVRIYYLPEHYSITTFKHYNSTTLKLVKQ